VAASKTGDQAPASAVCVTSPPHLTDDGDCEWFIYTGGRDGRRALQPGEHIAVDHPLAVQYPRCFRRSDEPPDAWPQSVLSREAARRQQAEQMRLASYPCRKVTPCCARCGAQSERSVVMADQPSQLQLVSALSDLEDHDWSGRQAVETKFAKLAQDVKEQQDELVRIEAEWRNQHVTCPPGTPAMDEPKAPDNVPLTWRLPGIRSLG
jgi:hypothetical protein